MTLRQLAYWVDAEAEETIAREQALSRKILPADDSSAFTGQNWVVDSGWM